MKQRERRKTKNWRKDVNRFVVNLTILICAFRCIEVWKFVRRWRQLCACREITKSVACVLENRKYVWKLSFWGLSRTEIQWLHRAASLHKIRADKKKNPGELQQNTVFAEGEWAQKWRWQEEPQPGERRPRPSPEMSIWQRSKHSQLSTVNQTRQEGFLDKGLGRTWNGTAFCVKPKCLLCSSCWCNSILFQETGKYL